MASKSSGGALMLVGIFLVAVVASPELRTRLSTMFGDGGGVEVVGEGEAQVMVAASAAADVRDCVARQGLTEQCVRRKFVIVDAARMPFIARNISTAWAAGKDGELTRDAAAEAVNRGRVCQPGFPLPQGGQCSEYPFAASREGGAGVQEHEVPARENQCRDSVLARGFAAGIGDGGRFLVVITHPGKVAPGPYQGTDLAEDQTAC